MRFLSVVVGAALAAATPWAAEPLFENLVSFGDSYTDDGRLGYYINHNGSAPPAGVYQNVSTTTASGGLAWGQLVQQRTGARYFDYAVSGATCSNQIISRLFPAIGKPFPSVLDDEIPSFQADVGAKTLYADRSALNTVYTLWIGTNDLGMGAFLTDSQAPGTNITTFVDCVWQVFDHIYQSGGRRFVLLNEAPLQLSPVYAAVSSGGAGNNQYWQNKTLYNQTEYQHKMMEYTTSVNTMFDYGVPFHLVVKKRWPGAAVAIFDVHRLLTDMHNSPASYLDAPANATGAYRNCAPTNSSGSLNCANSKSPMSSFLWYDELHPSEKTGGVIAKHFIDVVAGNSSYGTSYGWAAN